MPSNVCWTCVYVRSFSCFCISASQNEVCSLWIARALFTSESPQFITPGVANVLAGRCLPRMLKVMEATAALVPTEVGLPFDCRNPLSSSGPARGVRLIELNVLEHQNVPTPLYGSKPHRRQVSAYQPETQRQNYSQSMRSAPRKHGWWTPFP